MLLAPLALANPLAHLGCQGTATAVSLHTDALHINFSILPTLDQASPKTPKRLRAPNKLR